MNTVSNFLSISHKDELPVFDHTSVVGLKYSYESIYLKPWFSVLIISKLYQIFVKIEIYRI